MRRSPYRRGTQGTPGLCVREQERLVEAQRLEQRTRYDLEMMLELGYCNGIENYSRHLTGRGAGEAPPTLFDYLPEQTQCWCWTRAT